mmetsp:Transcript_48708/g.55990  ORF Transcript_48708/g.55990 Transcript_48708/m.55990 type:complete len:154 (-) Transcript_48708:39-500(-)
MNSPGRSLVWFLSQTSSLNMITIIHTTSVLSLLTSSSGTLLPDATINISDILRRKWQRNFQLEKKRSNKEFHWNFEISRYLGNISRDKWHQIKRSKWNPISLVQGFGLSLSLLTNNSLLIFHSFDCFFSLFDLLFSILREQIIYFVLLFSSIS